MPQELGPELSIETPPLDPQEKRKRKREGILIALLGFVFLALTVAEFHLSKVSNSLPFVNSIFFFGLLNVNIVILIALVWLVFRNIGKLFIERRRKILGARLKTKLVISFVGFSIIPTLVLFVISALYINSSFDKWFSIKIQNTLQASLEITRTYYRNTETTAMHFAEHIATGVGKRLKPRSLDDLSPAITPKWVAEFLESQRDLLALDAVEFYVDPLDSRVLANRPTNEGQSYFYQRLSIDKLEQAFAGEKVPVIEHMGSGDLIRCLVPVRAGARLTGPVAGVLVVSSYIPVSLVNKVDEIASVFDDYKDTNPLKYPMKTTYFVILIMITLVIMFVAIWMGLYLARELTVPVERLVYGAQSVGAGNLDVTISAIGHDEIAVLVQSFNKMTQDLRDNRERLTQASADLERRRLQLEAVLANIGTGVIAVDSFGTITTLNRAAAKLLHIEPVQAQGHNYKDVLQGESAALIDVISQAYSASTNGNTALPEFGQWSVKADGNPKMLAAVATSLKESESQWGVVVVIDDMTHLIKGQREMAWREVARRIAHEIKNPLTPIKLSAQRLQRRLSDFRGSDGNLLRECTDTIIKHTDELKEMVNEFSNFARFPEVSPTPNDINVALNEVVHLYKPAHPEISFKISLETKMPVFEFDRDQIKRVIINLFNNAVAAVKSRHDYRTKEIKLLSHYNEQLEMAVIEVSDNGPGMSEDVMARVFEPYFSTKAEGTGLGLAITKRIINDHDGFIRVHSVLGQGTEFLIELPTNLRQGIERRRSRMGGATGVNLKE